MSDGYTLSAKQTLKAERLRGLMVRAGEIANQADQQYQARLSELGAHYQELAGALGESKLSEGEYWAVEEDGDAVLLVRKTVPKKDGDDGPPRE